MSQELEYLRDELNHRIIFANENHNKIIGSILMVWGGVLLLFTVTQTNIVGGNEGGKVFWYFLIITILFISVVVSYCFSGRLYDNINQVLKLATYNIVFHEKRPNNSDEKDKIRAWELATFEMEDPKEKRYYKVNIEYIVLSVFATLMKIFLLIVLLVKPTNITGGVDILDLIMVVICVIYIIISSVLLSRIQHSLVLSHEKWYNKKKDYLNYFINYAVKT